MSDHHCHALGCKSDCPPAHLMCGPCWAKVPVALQHEVTKSCEFRNLEHADITWARWWRAQAFAIHHVAMLKEPSPRGWVWLTRELKTAERWERAEIESATRAQVEAECAQRIEAVLDDITRALTDNRAEPVMAAFGCIGKWRERLRKETP